MTTSSISSLAIIIDTREKKPYTFPKCQFPNTSTITKKLNYGDYSINGFENLVSVERKSLDDYVMTILNQMERFKRELLALTKFPFKLLIVEGSIQDINDHCYLSKVEPLSVLGLTNQIILDFSIVPLFAENRVLSEQIVHQFLSLANKRLTELVVKQIKSKRE